MSSSSSDSDTPNPVADWRHNTPLILCIVIGGVVAFATLSVGLAWLLRLACCGASRRARNREKLDRSTWTPSALAMAVGTLPHRGNANDATDDEGRSSCDTLVGKESDKKDKIKSFSELSSHLASNHPHNLAPPGQPPNPLATATNWNGNGWTLYDTPVASVQPPPRAMTSTGAMTNSNSGGTGGGGGGNYAVAKGEFADHDVQGFTWPSNLDRQSSFIERLVLTHHPDAVRPNSTSVGLGSGSGPGPMYGGQGGIYGAPSGTPMPVSTPQQLQPASRMASLGGAANRAVMNMLPTTLRNAATTASRHRETRKRYNQLQPYLDSDYEGTIGAKDWELPMARRVKRHGDRFAVDCTTEEEASPSLDARNNRDQDPGPLAHISIAMEKRDHNGGGQGAMAGIPPAELGELALLSPGHGTGGVVDHTPGLAGVGAAWSSRSASQRTLVVPPVQTQSSDIHPHIQPLSARPIPPTAVERSRASALPLPLLEGDRRTRLIGSVGRWLTTMDEVGHTADPYTAMTPRLERNLSTQRKPLRSVYSCSTLAAESVVEEDTSSSLLTARQDSGGKRRVTKSATAAAASAAGVEAAPSSRSAQSDVAAMRERRERRRRRRQRQKEMLRRAQAMTTEVDVDVEGDGEGGTVISSASGLTRQAQQPLTLRTTKPADALDEASTVDGGGERIYFS
ncbi:hypothetical protein BCV70DRAFT_22556 [Testicularia cyperi]|uniref:Uncharacterized protein n=1 Tax=Testicularia cyperi TaxID=1882483 RepID=A0A317Y043_9BASI|nr:hypothetical protein BCV70DRAFT_22556 [Testicularia cyperi]